MSGLVFAPDAPTPAERVKDAAVITVIALLLGIPMIGLTTVDQGGALQVATRWPVLGYFLAVVFVGRLVLRFVLDGVPQEHTEIVDRHGSRLQSFVAGPGHLDIAYDAVVVDRIDPGYKD